ncbi:hypothetical protein GOP47_0010432 [Adiantum capillus-veneris]|uniref:Uncharacterized protein n=1 Tax=Adiantum capillus-veneris TaxID=13818 RepID=A0A9D4ZIR4_ADICA|nr:hypothetical protein GOP47_0010432 [Adiantum capillus-veneris]
MVDWGRTLVLCCSVSRGCGALFARPLRRSEAGLEDVVACYFVYRGPAALIIVLSVSLWWIRPFCCVSCCSVHRGSAALLGCPLRRSVTDLGRRSVLLLLLFPVLSCCIVVLFFGLWWIGPFCCAALLRCVALLCCVIPPAGLWRFSVICGLSAAFCVNFRVVRSH